MQTYASIRVTPQAEDFIAENPAVPVTLPTVRRRRGRSWSSDEACKFLESARHDANPLYAAKGAVDYWGAAGVCLRDRE